MLKLSKEQLEQLLEIGGADDPVDEATLVELVDAYQQGRRPECSTTGINWAVKDRGEMALLRDLKYWTGDKRIPDGEIPEAELPAEVLSE